MVVLERIMGSVWVWSWIYVISSSTLLASWLLLMARLCINVQQFIAWILSHKHPQSPLACYTQWVEGKIILAYKRRKTSWTELETKGERKKKPNPCPKFPPFSSMESNFFSSSPWAFSDTCWPFSSIKSKSESVKYFRWYLWKRTRWKQLFRVYTELWR